MALINCPECGKQVTDTIEQCIHCGYMLHKHTNPQCPECGKEVENTQKQCNNCGFLLSNNEDANEQVDNCEEQDKDNPALKQCKRCKRYVSIMLDVCPHCGNDIRTHATIVLQGLKTAICIGLLFYGLYLLIGLL